MRDARHSIVRLLDRRSCDARDRGRAWWAWLGLLAACALAIEPAAQGQTPGRGAATSDLTNRRQLTSSPAIDISPTLSPDGRFVAYSSNEAGNYDIWVAPTAGGSPVNRTSDHAGADSTPRWSPDGRQIAFNSAREGGGIFVMPADGGAVRKVAQTEYLTPAAWSSDGAELAYARWIENRPVVEIQNLTSGTTRRVAFTDGTVSQRLDLSWSSDGKFLAYVAAFNYTAQVTQLWVQPLNGGPARSITNARTMEWSPVWAQDSRSLYFTSNRGGPPDIWRQPVDAGGAPQGSPVRVTVDAGAAGVALSRDNARVAYSTFRRIGNVWRVPILPDRQATWTDTRQVTSDRAHIEYVAVSLDGSRLMVSSDRSGNPDLWVLPIGGGAMRQVTTDPTPDWNPAWSPDGLHVAFYAFRSGNREIWTQPVEGGTARQLTRGVVDSRLPTWSPDGKFVAFSSPRSGNADIWVVGAEGGEARQLTSDEWGDSFPVYSADGKWVYFSSGGPQGSRLRRVPAGGGPIEVFSKGQGTQPTRSPDGKWIYFISNRSGTANLWAISIDGQTERQLTNFSGKRGFFETSSAIATDGQALYVIWREDIGDIWVADLSAATSSARQ